MQKNVYAVEGKHLSYDAWYSVVELRDIPDEVDEIRFSMRNYELSDIKMPRKQYPNVKIIHIGSDVKRLNIPNSMFPNVEHVISEGNPIFESGSMLITNERETGLKMRILKNTFCKKPGDVIDLKGVEAIDEYAFEGCMSKNIINVLNLRNAWPNAFKGYPFALSDTCSDIDENGVCMVGNIVMKIDDNADIVKIPLRTSVINSDIDFSGVKCLSVYLEQLERLMILSCVQSLNAQALMIQCSDEITNPYAVSNMLSKYRKWIDAERYEAPEDSMSLTSKDGILYSKDMTTLIACPTKRKGAIDIPEGVENIASQAFEGTEIASVRLPDTLKWTSGNDFDRCNNLEHIDFGHGLKSIDRIGRCLKLKEVEIPGQVRTISWEAFKTCYHLKHITLNEGLRAIRRDAFRGCSELSEITLPSTVTELGYYSLWHVKKIILKGQNIPKGLVSSVAESDITNYEDYSAALILVKTSDISFYIPKYIRQVDINELDKLMQKPDFIYSDLPYSLYRYGKTYEMKMKTAFEMYKMNQDENLKKYIKRTGKKIAANLLKNEEYKDFSELLTWGLVSKPALKELLETVRETGHPEVEASILEAIGQQHIAKNKFSL